MKSNPSKLTALDLFSGVGGLTLGLKRAGFSVLAAVEQWDIAAESYSVNHPEVYVHNGDIRELDPSSLRKKLKLKRGGLDLLAGCPPCQGFSTLRTRKKSNSARDSRNALLFEFIRFIDEFEPKAILLENVPALASSEKIKKFKTALRSRGYFIDKNSVQVVDAADYGVPQRRKRMILHCVKNGRIENPAIECRVSVKQALGAANLPPAGSSGDFLHDMLQKHKPHVIQIIRSIPVNGGSRSSLPENLVLECHKRQNGGFRDVYGRMKWDDVSPTITGGCTNPSKGRFLHPQENRSVTLREAALLQTFPKNYYISINRGRESAALMIGNALPPLMIEKHALSIRNAIK